MRTLIKIKNDNKVLGRLLCKCLTESDQAIVTPWCVRVSMASLQEEEGQEGAEGSRGEGTRRAGETGQNQSRVGISSCGHRACPLHQSP